MRRRVREPGHPVDHRGTAQLAVVHAQGGDHGGEPEARPQRLLDEEVVGVALALLGEGVAGAPHHHEAQAEKGHGDGHEGEVRGELLSHGPSPPKAPSPRAGVPRP